ncbi:MAG: beta-ketoacyl-ACP synthase II [Methylocystis sp.]
MVTACATGTHAIGDAGRIIAVGDADVMVAGGAESPVNRIGVAGFAACRALSTGFNDRPEAASRPYDKDRDGFVLGEGAGCVVLEEYEQAKARGAKIYAELIGYGMSGDAYHITAPAPDGDGAYRCMKAALKRAGISVSDIDYVNAHGTSTPLGDEIELKAVERLLGNVEPKLAMSSTKSCIGHLLGAAGAVEAIFSLLAMRDGVAPPTINLVAGYVSIMHGLKGPNHAVVTACATGTHAIGDAGRIIAVGEADVMVAGGAESPVNSIGVAGFAACRALSTGFNDRPEAASRPYDKDRDGFVLGEGAGCVVLEEYEHAKARGAKIYAELIGYGLSGDAYHITAPAPDGDGAYRCMKAALKRAGISVTDIDYVNAHGTSTPLGDEIELKAVERLLGNVEPKLAMSSTKSAIGHLLGAAGAVEAIYSILAMQANVAPPTRNLDNPSVETTIDLVPHKAREKEINIALSNSFGFGGTNASLLFRRAS